MNILHRLFQPGSQLRNGARVVKTRQKLAKNRSLHAVNEGFESIFNPVFTSAAAFQQAAGRSLAQLSLIGLLVITPVQAEINSSELSVADLWQAVQQHDPGLKMAQAQLQASAANQQMARALYYPKVKLELDAGITRHESEMQQARFSAPGFGSSKGVNFATAIDKGLGYGWSLVAQQPLLNGSLSAQQQILSDQAALGKLQWQAARNQTLVNTVDSYYKLVLANYQVKVLQQQLDATQEMLDESTERFRLGNSPITDTYEAESAVSGLQAQVLMAQADRQMAIQQISTISGLAKPNISMSTALRSLQKSIEQLMQQSPTAGIADIWQQTKANNNLLQQRQLAIQLAQGQANQRDAAYQPQLSALAMLKQNKLSGSGGYSINGKDAENSENRYYAGINFSMPLYSGGMRKAQSKQAQAQLQQARFALLQSQNQVKLSITRLQVQIDAIIKSIQATEKTVFAAEAQLDATKTGKAAGDRTTLNVLQAENQLARAQLQLLERKIQLIMSELQLELAVRNEAKRVMASL